MIDFYGFWDIALNNLIKYVNRMKIYLGVESVGLVIDFRRVPIVLAALSFNTFLESLISPLTGSFP